MLFPFLEMLFNGEKTGNSGFMGTTDSATVRYVRKILVDSINGPRGKEGTLAWICVFIIVSIFLKNLFLYLAYRVLNPLKNKIVNRLRDELYEKILHLPIGFFTEKKKGDVISRMTNDVGEVEASVIGTLEGWVRDPLTIIITLITLLIISVPMTVFVLICIPVVGFVIGRITKSLKRQSQDVAVHYAESVSILDETLSGLRVIKAFNSELLLKQRFFQNNENLLTVKNEIGYRRDLASPTSEFLGVIIFTLILYFGGILVLSHKYALTSSLLLTYRFLQSDQSNKNTKHFIQQYAQRCCCH